MTAEELLGEIETQFAAELKKGLCLHGVYAIPPESTGIWEPAKGDTKVHPSTHSLHLSRPFIFDIRKLPEVFLGFEFKVLINTESMPDEFRDDLDDENDFDKTDEELMEEEEMDDGYIHWDERMSPEKVIAYAEANALDICEQFNDYSLTLKNICDMIVGRDFEHHKKWCEEEKMKRMNLL